MGAVNVKSGQSIALIGLLVLLGIGCGAQGVADSNGRTNLSTESRPVGQGHTVCHHAVSALTSRPGHIRFAVRCDRKEKRTVGFFASRYKLNGESGRTDIVAVRRELQVREGARRSRGQCEIVGSVIACHAEILGRAMLEGEFSVGMADRCAMGVAISIVRNEPCLRGSCPAGEIRQIVLASGKPRGCA